MVKMVACFLVGAVSGFVACLTAACLLIDDDDDETLTIDDPWRTRR